MSLRAVPVTIITGFLGVGKTTAIAHLLEHHRPPEERWAVLVNEFGEVGVDGLLLEDASARAGEGEGEGAPVAIKEVPGGCICCTGGVMFQVALTLLLKETRPDRLIIEPTGIAEPGALLDTLASSYGDVLSPRATITLIDPERLLDPKYANHDAFLDQIEAADVLVANKMDRASAAGERAFDRLVEESFPPRLASAKVIDGALDPAWLMLDPRRLPEGARHGDGASQASSQGSTRPPLILRERDIFCFAREENGNQTRTFLFGRAHLFDSQKLSAWLKGMASGGELMPGGYERLKGVFHTDRGWASVNGTPDGARSRQSQYRRDSRVEVIAPAGDDIDWITIENRLHEALES